MSAYSHKVVTVNETKFPLINKPFIADDLIRKVTETLDSLIKERRAVPIEGRGSKSWLRRIGRG